MAMPLSRRIQRANEKQTMRKVRKQQRECNHKWGEENQAGYIVCELCYAFRK